MTLHCPKGHPVKHLSEIDRHFCSTCRVAYLPSQCHEQAELFRPEPRPDPVYTLGIDPGATTGLGLLEDDRLIWSTTLRLDLVNGGRDLEDAADTIAALCRGKTLAFAERPVAARKGQASVKTWMGLGAYLGRVEHALWLRLGMYPVRVEVRWWREAVGLKARCSKDQSIMRARAVPGAAEIEDHNEAEAVLIAEAGRTR